MLIKKLISTLVITGCAFTCHAKDYKFIANNSSLATQLCIEAANNNKSGVKHVMKMLYGDRTSVLGVNTLRCNDLSLARFSYKYEAIDTFKYLNRISYKENRVETQTYIRDVALLPSDKVNGPSTVYVLAKR